MIAIPHRVRPSPRRSVPWHVGRLTFLIVIAWGLGACVAPVPVPAERLALPPDADVRGPSVAIVALAPLPIDGFGLPMFSAEVPDENRVVAQYEPLGLQGGGLLQLGVREAQRDDARAVAAARHETLLTRSWFEPLATALRERGYRVVGDALVVRHPNEFASLGPPWSRRVDMAPLGLPEEGNWSVLVGSRSLDLAPLAAELSAERLLVLDLMRVGANRWFGPFAIPTSRPFSVGAATVELVEPGAPEPLLHAYAEHVEYADRASGAEAKARSLVESVELALAATLEVLRPRVLGALR